MICAPADCKDMTEVRGEIDRLDKVLVKLLAERARYVMRAADIKKRDGIPPVVPARVKQVIENVRNEAQQQGLDADLAEKIWTAFIDWAHNYESKAINGT